MNTYIKLHDIATLILTLSIDICILFILIYGNDYSPYPIPKNILIILAILICTNTIHKFINYRSKNNTDLNEKINKIYEYIIN